MSEPRADESTTRVGDEPALDRSVRGSLRKGDSVDRFVVLEWIGRGGAGEVYRAYDPDLDRRVAIKVLWRLADDVVGARARLLHEARALARLRHPCVVQVFDAGVDGERVFLAMEYLQGPTLAAWLRSSPRTWQATAQVLLAAGQGLAAAHDAGLLHRDVKPTNVIVTDAGRVCMIDFGLAEPHDPDTDRAARTSSAARGPNGTPAYLAPDLYDGVAPSVASDVFSFCVMAWEALFGARPWSADDEIDLLARKRQGPPAIGRTTVARGVVEALRRGLVADPATRTSSLAPVLAAIERAIAPRARRWLMAGTLGLAGVGIAAWALRPGPCAEAGEAADAVWNVVTRAAVRDGLLAGATPFAPDVWLYVGPAIDEHVARWTAARVDACAASYERHEQSPELFDARIACFDRQLAALDSMLALYASGDPEIAARAVDMLAALDPASSCDREALLRARGHAVAPEHAAVLDRVRVLESAARYHDAMVLVDELLASGIDADADARLEADYLRGRLLDRTGDPRGALRLLEDLHWRAEIAGADLLAAKAAVYVAFELAAVEGRPADALQWAPHAQAAIERAGDDGTLRATLLENEGTAHLAQLDGDTALQRYEAALAIREELAFRDPLGLLSTLGSIGILLEELHRYDEALAMGQRALALAQSIVGDAHPHTARSHDNLGTTLLRMGRVDEALVHLERALEIRRAALGDAHPLVALSSSHLGLAHLDRGDPARAVEHYRRAVELGAAAQVSVTSQLRYREGLAHSLDAAGHRDEALEHARVAHEGLRASFGATHPEVEGLRALIERLEVVDVVAP